MGTKREVLRWVRRVRVHIDLGGTANLGIGSCGLAETERVGPRNTKCLEYPRSSARRAHDSDDRAAFDGAENQQNIDIISDNPKQNERVKDKRLFF